MNKAAPHNSVHSLLIRKGDPQVFIGIVAPITRRASSSQSTLAFVVSACKDTHMQTDSPRSQNFAKLLTYEGKQALAFLQRDTDENLVVVVQLWSDATDHQIRAVIAAEYDDQTLVAFDAIDDASLAEFLDASGLAQLLV